MGSGGGMAAFLMRELQGWAGERFDITNTGYQKYTEMWFRWRDESRAVSASPAPAALDPVAPSPFVSHWTVGEWESIRGTEGEEGGCW